MKKSQCERIVEYMRRNGEITQRDAFYLGCQRLASRIHDLKERGIGIKTETRKVKNADGTVSHIAVYSLLDGEAEDIGGEKTNE